MIYLRLFLLLAIISSACVVPLEAFAATDAEKAIVARMRERQDMVDDYKQEGLYGENNRGLLQARAPLEREQRKVLIDENADREALYALIARETGTSASVVATRRAEQIAKRSAKGIWLQNAKGEWYRKE